MWHGVPPLAPVFAISVDRVSVEGVLHVLPKPQQLQLGVQVEVSVCVGRDREGG